MVATFRKELLRSLVIDAWKTTHRGLTNCFARINDASSSAARHEASDANGDRSPPRNSEFRGGWLFEVVTAPTV